MNIGDAANILNEAGKPVAINSNELLEINPPYENYHYVKKSGDKWEFGLMLVEKQNRPYEKKIKDFQSEKDAVMYFTMNRLSAFYFEKRISPFMMRHKELDIGGPRFNEEKLDAAISLIGIPPTQISFKGTEVVPNSIIVEKKHDKFVVEYRGENGEIMSTTLPVSHKRALFFAFKKLFLLHLFIREVKAIMSKHLDGKDITDKDISLFLN